MAKIQILPTILVKSEKEFKDKIKKLSPVFNLAQIDVLNDTLIKGKSFHDLGKIKKMEAPWDYELHLMVNNPEWFFKKGSKFKKIKRAIWHYEGIRDEKHMRQLLVLAKKNKWQTGLAISPKTPVSKITPWLLSFNVILVMTVVPGKNGAKFLPGTLEKIKKLKRRQGSFKIAVDGGMTDQTAPLVVKAGATLLASGSYLMKGEDPKLQLKKMQDAIT